MPDPITHPQTVQVCNRSGRVAANRLMELFAFADEFALKAFAPEVMAATGITPAMVAAPGLPSEAEFPDAVIEDGAVQDGRPPMTRRRWLQLMRVVLQFRDQTLAEVYDTPAYVRQVVAAVATYS